MNGNCYWINIAIYINKIINNFKKKFKDIFNIIKKKGNMFIMNKSKYVIYILVIVLIIIVLSYIIKINKKDLPEQENTIKINEIENSEGKYDIYDKNTNKLIVENVSEDQIKLYRDNPDYNPSGT